MSNNNSKTLADRLYRIVLILAASIFFGVLVYWITPDLSPYIGENGAALWSWGLLVICGVAAHWLLPKSDLSPVSGVLFAVLSSAVAAMLAALVLIIVVLPVDIGQAPQMLFALCLVVLPFAGVVFVPLHLARRHLGRSVVFLYFLAGTGIPAAFVMILRPVDPRDYVGDLMLAVALGLVGACAAIGFAIATASSRRATTTAT